MKKFVVLLFILTLLIGLLPSSRLVHADRPPAPSPANPYGITIRNTIHSQYFSCSSTQDFQDVGVTWARVQIHWSDIEQTQGQYTWTLLDTAVQCARQARLLIDFPIQKAPTWQLSQCPDPTTNLPQLPGSAAEANFALQLVKHITTTNEGDVIKAIEVGNEEWSFVKGTCQNNPSVYIPVLEQTYTAIKHGGQGVAGIPHMLVGTYGYTNYSTVQKDVSPYWNAFFSDASNPGNYMDYANFHFYHGATDPNQQELLPSLRDPYNLIWQAIQGAAATHRHAGMPIWTTETGWPINQNAIQPACVTEQNQQIFEQEELDDARMTAGSTVTHLFIYTMDMGDAGDSLTQAQNPLTLCYLPPLNSCTGPNATLYYTGAYCMLRTYIHMHPNWRRQESSVS